VAYIHRVRDIYTEYNRATTCRVLPVGTNKQVVSLACIHNLRQLAFNEITAADLDFVERCIAMNAPAGDWAQVLLGDHLAKISGIAYFLEYVAETLLVTASRRCGEAHQVPPCVRFKEAEVFKDSTIRERHGVMRFINDNEEEFLRAELAEPSSPGSAESWDRGYDDLSISRRS
jgi:hypothetical protein